MPTLIASLSADQILYLRRSHTYNYLEYLKLVKTKVRYLIELFLQILSIMSTIRALRSIPNRTRLPVPPRRLRTGQRPYQQKPKKEGSRFNSLHVLTSLTSVSLGWLAHEFFPGLWSGNASKSKPSPGPEVLAQLIDNPRLPSHEKSQVRKDRATAEKYLLDHYPGGKFNIILDASLPGDYYYDSTPPFTGHENDDESSASTQPVALYRIERNHLWASKGKTVALLLYAHPDANLGTAALALRMQTIVQAMDDAGVLAIDLTGESLATFTQRGEWIESLTWRSLPRS